MTKHKVSYALVKIHVPHYYDLGVGDWLEVFNPLVSDSVVTRFSGAVIDHDAAVNKLSQLVLDSVVNRVSAERRGFVPEYLRDVAAFNIAKNIYDWASTDDIQVFSLQLVEEFKKLTPELIVNRQMRIDVNPTEYLETGSVEKVLFAIKVRS